MRLTVVGCAGSFPGPDSPASCYLLEAEHEGRTWRVLLDLGNGALGALQRHIDPMDVDAVLVSHLHPDHCMDLCGFYVMRSYHPRGAAPRIPVYAPEGAAEQMAAAYGLQTHPGMHEAFDFRLWEDGATHRVGPFRVTVRQVRHPVPAYALRVEADGAVLAYSGDTGPCDELVEIARGADVFLAEASFREIDDNPPDLHLTGRQAGEAGRDAEVDHLVLTHVPAWFARDTCEDEAREVFTGRLSRARSGMVLDL